MFSWCSRRTLSSFSVVLDVVLGCWKDQPSETSQSKGHHESAGRSLQAGRKPHHQYPVQDPADGHLRYTHTCVRLVQGSATHNVPKAILEQQKNKSIWNHKKLKALYKAMMQIFVVINKWKHLYLFCTFCSIGKTLRMFVLLQNPY